tara:strand:- start:962 stop:1525 length:564 start_codon:yes stop_codon:yes gene_type:complete
MSLPEHLGGHKNRTHLDEGSLDHCIKTFNIKSMLDIGCGPGGMVELAKSKGLKAYGIDGDFEVKRSKNISKFVTIHDYETGPSPLDINVDLIWSVEFLEHVWEKYQDNYMKDFQRGKFVVCTFSEKNGHHHVNLKPASYWIDVFKDYGFSHDADMTKTIREVTTLNITGKFAHKPFVKTHGLFFVRN